VGVLLGGRDHLPLPSMEILAPREGLDPREGSNCTYSMPCLLCYLLSYIPKAGDAPFSLPVFGFGGSMHIVSTAEHWDDLKKAHVGLLSMHYWVKEVNKPRDMNVSIVR
jgi:hypothetical protein